MSVFYKYLKAIKTPFHSLSLPALAAWNAWKAQLLPSGLNHFLIKMVACSSEPVGDTFLWLTTSSGFHKFIMGIMRCCNINNIHFIIHKNFIYGIIDLCNAIFFRKRYCFFILSLPFFLTDFSFLP